LTILPSFQEVTCISPSPVSALKSIKNSTEIEGFRQSHIRDGAALARYFAWLEEQLQHGVELNESQGADQLEKFRSYVPPYFNPTHTYLGHRELDLFRGLSFPTISAAGPNGGKLLGSCNLIYLFSPRKSDYTLQAGSK
jgi:Xaa-Pro aminopeptidase